LLIHRRAALEEYVSSKVDIAGVLFLGVLMQIGGTLLDDRQAYINALGTTLVLSGLTLLALPLIVHGPRRLLSLAPMRILAWTGVISYAVLIVNEPVRLVASMLRVEDVPSAAWWLFLTAVYVPATLLLAWPFAALTGMVPRRRTSSTPATETGSASGVGVPAG
ncbi:MAG TPA: hypothetical protein VIH21_12565, partial [Dehalococcoidia bacterium]